MENASLSKLTQRTEIRTKINKILSTKTGQNSRPRIGQHYHYSCLKWRWAAMIPLYTPVPHIATNNSDTERKNNRKSMRVIIYTVVKINSRPIGIGEREKVSSSTQEEKCTPGQTYSYKEPKLTGQNKLPTTDPSPLQSLLSKMAVDRQPFTLHSSVPQTDTTNSVIERIVARIATVP